MIHSTNLLKTCTSSSLSWNMVSGLCSKVSLTYLNQVPHYLGYLNTPGNSIPKVTHYLRYLTTSGTSIPQVHHYLRYLNTSDTSIPQVPHYLRYITNASTAILLAVPILGTSLPKVINTAWTSIPAAVQCHHALWLHQGSPPPFCVSSRFLLRSQSSLSNLRSEI